jgi:Zn-dependent peptidase ImmA (M78 family)
VSTAERLAHELGFPASFFFRADMPAVDNVSFRAQSRMRARTRDQALAMSVLIAEFDRWLHERFRFNEPSLPPELQGCDPAAAALALREHCGLGIGPAPNLVHLAELLGVRVMATAFASERLDAFSYWSGRRPYVALNSKGTAERRRWNLAHEIGHLVLHSGPHHLPGDRKSEDEADGFAAELLMPAEGVRLLGGLAPSLQSVRQQKLHWKVSAMAYIRRLRDLEFITDWQHRSLVVEASSAKLRSSEDDIEREASPVLAMVMSDLRAKGYTEARIAKELSLRSDDIAVMIHGLAPTVLAGGGAGGTGLTPRLRLLP